jgi:hypothetical protein
VGRNLASANRDSRKSENHKKNDAVSRCLNPTSCGRFFSEIPCYRKKKSLLFEIFSLLIFAGNSPRSGCSTAASCCEIASQSSKNVKFPVSREFALETGAISTASPRLRLRVRSSVCRVVVNAIGHFRHLHKISRLSHRPACPQEDGYDRACLVMVSRLTLPPETILVTGECATPNSNRIPDGTSCL